MITVDRHARWIIFRDFPLYRELTSALEESQGWLIKVLLGPHAHIYLCMFLLCVRRMCVFKEFCLKYDLLWRAPQVPIYQK